MEPNERNDRKTKGNGNRKKQEALMIYHRGTII